MAAAQQKRSLGGGAEESPAKRPRHTQQADADGPIELPRSELEGFKHFTMELTGGLRWAGARQLCFTGRDALVVRNDGLVFRVNVASREVTRLPDMGSTSRRLCDRAAGCAVSA